MQATEWPMASQGGIVDDLTEFELVTHGYTSKTALEAGQWQGTVNEGDLTGHTGTPSVEWHRHGRAMARSRTDSDAGSSEAARQPALALEHSSARIGYCPGRPACPCCWLVTS